MAAYDLTGKVAIVTGGANGMGEAHCRLLAERGAHVIIGDIDVASGERLAEEIRSAGHGASFVSLDVASEENWLSLVGDAQDRHGRIDILVNNAGVARITPVAEATVAEFDLLFAVNMKGVFLGCKSVLSGMKSAGGGSIVNISSLAGLRSGVPNTALYGATKGAIRLFTKALAVEYGPYKIRVNSVHPGLILTALSREYLDSPEMFKMLMGATIFDRPGETMEVAEVVAFLASPAASYMTGAEVSVDGGWAAN